MTAAKSTFITLEDFLQLPETKPPKEYMRGQIISKPMPKSRHSRLQGKLIYAINEVTEAKQIAYAFPELRCTFGGRSIVPDIAVFRWESIPVNEQGEPLDNVMIAPDWSIEILSPDQSANRVTDNLLHSWLWELIINAENRPENIDPSQRWLVESGLYAALAGGRLKYEVAA